MSQKKSGARPARKKGANTASSAKAHGERVLRKDQDDVPEIFQDRALPPTSSKPVKAEAKPLPTWYKALMFGLMILGLLWIVTFYIMQSQGPIASWGGWNITAGFGLIAVGFVMMMRWR